MLCRENGATCAYTPMFHSRLFAQDPKYRQAQDMLHTSEDDISSVSYYLKLPHRSDVWSTCPADRPLLVQFCANDPAFLVQVTFQYVCE